jgi:hypothetical protein
MSKSWSGLVELVPRTHREVASVPAEARTLKERAGWVAAASLFGTIDSVKLAAGLARLGGGIERHRDLQGPDQRCWAGDHVALLAADLAVPAISKQNHTRYRSALDPCRTAAPAPRTWDRGGATPRDRRTVWGDFASLGWFDADGIRMLLGVRYPSGYAAAHWMPQRTGEDLDEQLPARDTSSTFIDDIDEHEAFGRAAARYLIVLGLLAETENSSLRIELDKDKKTRIHHVYVGERKPQARDHAAPTASTVDGRIAEQSRVSGHLKRQRYGAGNAQVKWIYITEYSARRWHGPRWDVSGRTKSSRSPRQRGRDVPTSHAMTGSACRAYCESKLHRSSHRDAQPPAQVRQRSRPSHLEAASASSYHTLSAHLVSYSAPVHAAQANSRARACHF